MYQLIRKVVCVFFCCGAVSGLAETSVNSFAETNSVSPEEIGSVDSVETNLDSLVKTDSADSIAETPRPPVPARRPLRIERAVFLVETESGSGSGFLMQQDGRIYFVSNIHVMSGGEKFSIKNVYGETVSVPNVVEVASDRDLIRFPVPSYEKGFGISGEYGFGDKVCAVGNSGGGGVITRLDGEIMALGPGLVEMSCKIIPGNSGGPVLSTNNQIVGVSTYLQNHKNMPDWIIEGSRFTETRRMAVRIDNVEWSSMDWETFRRETAYLSRVETYVDDIVAIIDSLSDDGNKMIYSDTDHSGLQTWLQGHNQDVRKAGGRWKKVTTGSTIRYEVSSNIQRRFRTKIEDLAELMDDFDRLASRDDKVSIPHFKNQLEKYHSYLENGREQMETIVETMF